MSTHSSEADEVHMTPVNFIQQLAKSIDLQISIIDDEVHSSLQLGGRDKQVQNAFFLLFSNF